MFPTTNTPELEIVPGTKSNPDGSKSSTATPVASPGPKFSKNIENVIVSPTDPERGKTDFVICKSANSSVISALSSSSSLWSPSSLLVVLFGSD